MNKVIIMYYYRFRSNIIEILHKMSDKNTSKHNEVT